MIIIIVIVISTLAGCLPILYYAQANVRGWVSKIKNADAFKSSASLLAKQFKGAADPAAEVDPRQGLLAVVKNLFEIAVQKAFPEYAGKQKGYGVAEVTKCTNPQHGDYQVSEEGAHVDCRSIIHKSFVRLHLYYSAIILWVSIRLLRLQDLPTARLSLRMLPSQ